MSDLSKDISFYQSISGELETQHTGEWVLIHEQKVIDIYKTFEDAAKYAVKTFGEGPYLIRQIGAPPVTLPASVAFFLKNYA